MGSPITFSGFNKIDFGMILDAVMEQEQAPLRTLQAQQKEIESRATTYRTLATKLAAFETAVNALGGNNSLSGRKATNTDPTVVNASASDSAAAGLYDVVVQELARAQVTAATSFPPDADQTIVAASGTIVIGGVTVNIDSPLTLQGLADRINGTADIPVTATVVRAAPNSWQLVMTGRSTGAAGAFTITNALAGAAPGGAITFGDADNDGVSGNSAADNAVAATDAKVLINNVAVTSSTNTVSDAILGVTLQLLKKDPNSTATITVGDDMEGAKENVQKLVTAFNDLIKFAEDQNLAASTGDGSSIARDPLLRGLRGDLRDRLTADYAAGGEYSSLASIGLGFDRTGRLTFKAATFDKAVEDGRADVAALFSADGTDQGVFRQLKDTIAIYTDADGLLKTTGDRLDDQSRAISVRIADLEDRLAIRRQVLQQEYAAADLMMTQLNSQASSLSSLGSQYSLF
jgi:flagellar hook-associated protein 2